MMRPRTTLLGLSVLALIASACGGAHRAAGGSGIVSQSGLVGPLRLGLSSAADVRRFAGAPAFDGTGTFEVFAEGSYRAFGYDCAPRAPGMDPGAYKPAGTRCRTAYFFDRRTDKLEAFWTDSASFRILAGTAPGMSVAAVRRREQRRIVIGGYEGLQRGTAAATLRVDVSCRIAQPKCGNGSVDDLALESTNDPVGLLFI